MTLRVYFDEYWLCHRTPFTFTTGQPDAMPEYAEPIAAEQCGITRAQKK